VGSFDDILCISLVPDPLLASESLTAADFNEKLSSQKRSLLPLVGLMRVAVVSNSPVVHLLDNTSTSTPLVGHTDIVLSVQCSPDGFVSFSSLVNLLQEMDCHFF
jgi:hypothetical protein